MPEMPLRPGFTYSVCRPFAKNKEAKNLKKQEVQDILIFRDILFYIFKIKLAFNMIWLIEILKI